MSLFLFSAKAGLAEFIQPGLVQLQPNIDEFMDTLEPLQSLHGKSHLATKNHVWGVLYFHHATAIKSEKGFSWH
jgi:hypothetical protein